MGPRAVVLLALLASGCGTSTGTSGPPAAEEYDGPLYLTRVEAEHPRAGAAGDVVECRTWGDGGFDESDLYEGGATADSPEEALDVAWHEGGFGGPREGLRVAAREDDRVLYVVEAHGSPKQAVIVRDGPATDGAGGPGWYVESWARCDYSELPRAYTDSLGLHVWTDASGRPAPTTRVQSWTGPQHCGWESMTFMSVGGEDPYVRDPLPGLRSFFDLRYAEHVRVPADAVDTGFSRDGSHLWLSADRRRAYVGSEGDAEAWPKTARPLGCD